MWEDYVDGNKIYETDGCYVPSHIMSSIIRYIESGNHPGSFLAAVIVNDLGAAVTYGDREAIQNITAIYKFFYNCCPGDCWGNEKKMSVWIKRKGLRR